ncbi:cytochrome P450 4C1-like [Leguminivora glycinivorella]|uniref:cytochrome P450 4C1-like n=1 Tax=Leguminivora glycinivorella TaxID=1035111 RepID=UPI00200BBEFF|nr:cytochrome P450 4C1-like [Leguminivora glycinivorella]
MFWLTILFLALLYITWKVLTDDDPLDKLPGPRKWPILGNSFILTLTSQEEYFVLVREFVKQYGDRFVYKLFNTRVLSICGAKDTEVILSHSRNISKSSHYKFVEPMLGTGLLLSTGNKWHSRRKLLTPTFHFNILKNFSVVMEERSRAFVGQLWKTMGEEVEVASVIKDFTLYTICETAMGISLDLDKSKPALEYLDAVINIGPLILERNISPWLQPDFIYHRLPAGRRHDKYLKTIHSFSDNLIHGRKQQRMKDMEEFETIEEDGVKKRLAFLDLLLEVESRGEIDLEGIREEVNTFMFEGHDTTANALIFSIMLLANHPEAQDKIREEYRMIIGGKDRAFTMSDFTEMKYLEAVIKETLRLYPSVPFIGRTVTEDFMLDNILVRAGTQVALRIYDLQRRQDLFPDPDEFKPERFLDAEHRPYAFVPFSAGPRNCIGQRFAMMEMKCVLSMICEKFRLVPRIQNHRPALTADLVLRAVEPIYVRFLPR